MIIYYAYLLNEKHFQLTVCLLQIKLRTILVVSPEGGHKHLDNKISI